jgi:hypothetical protein
MPIAAGVIKGAAAAALRRRVLGRLEVGNVVAARRQALARVVAPDQEAEGSSEAAGVRPEPSRAWGKVVSSVPTASAASPA